MTEKPRIWTFIKENYFIFGIFCSIILAELSPRLGGHGGPLRPELLAKHFTVFVIFFSSSVAIKWRELSLAVKQCQLHFFIQSISFFYIPVFVHIFLIIFEFFITLDSWIHKGLIIVSCMPPPVSSAVILVKSAEGNEAAAVFNSALGSILGILLTPTMLLINVGISSSVPMFKMVFQMAFTMVLPVLLGQVCQKIFSSESLARIPFSVFGQISLLYIIYTSFCDMFGQDLSVDAYVILMTVLLVVVIQVILMFSVFQIAQFLSKKSKIFTAQDVIAVTFCSTHKSLTLGIPLLKTLYGGYSHLSHISLPLLIYHPVQLILGGFIVPYGKKWVKSHFKFTSLVPGKLLAFLVFIIGCFNFWNGGKKLVKEMDYKATIFFKK